MKQFPTKVSKLLEGQSEPANANYNFLDDEIHDPLTHRELCG